MVDCISSSTAVNSGSSLLISIKTVDWLLVLGGGCHMTGAIEMKICVWKLDFALNGINVNEITDGVRNHFYEVY